MQTHSFHGVDQWDLQSPIPHSLFLTHQREPHSAAGRDSEFHCSGEHHCHVWLQRWELVPGKNRGSSDAPSPVKNTAMALKAK